VCSASSVGSQWSRFEEQQQSNCAKADKDTRLVRILVGLCEDTVKLPVKQAKDRRIQKTQNLLREALATLIREKDYDSIVIKEILDRANVGRSTFYMHFRDKDDLLVSGIHEMIGSVQSAGLPSSTKPEERIIRFALPIFEYLYQHRRAGEAKMGTRGRAMLHEHLRKVLAELIAADVRRDFQGRRRASGPIPPDLLVQHVASTFILVLNWWVESKNPLPPKEVNALFRSLVSPILAATFQ
jgi:AcrR family transcriptional regulator